MRQGGAIEAVWCCHPRRVVLETTKIISQKRLNIDTDREPTLTTLATLSYGRASLKCGDRSEPSLRFIGSLRQYTHPAFRSPLYTALLTSYGAAMVDPLVQLGGDWCFVGACSPNPL